ncbi:MULTISPECIES: prepilin-type N-terminal cleavage/methylation domain-containing protein [Bhargavaea]|uniref:Prepilin-type N-terminal cleavage/methylation domain-containing protein n=1 Tax=Bhargavaea changchunensis TaxID=2134037 RepID=A0ABW2NEZ0_9BACL
MERLKNEKGLTLTELLAVLVLASLVLTITMTAFGIGAKYQAAETEKVKLQQEMNLLITQLTHAHRSGACYELLPGTSGLVRKVYEREGGSRRGACTTTELSTAIEEKFAESYAVDVSADRILMSPPDPSNPADPLILPIDPLSENVKLSLTLKMDSGREFTQTTMLTRYKE